MQIGSPQMSRQAFGNTQQVDLSFSSLGIRAMQGETLERWKVLCEQASKEQDREKLLALIKEITRLLEEKRIAAKRVETFMGSGYAKVTTQIGNSS